MYYFSTAAFNIFFFIFSFNLTVMYLGVDIFGFIQFGSVEVLKCVGLSFAKFEKFSSNDFSNIVSASHSLSSTSEMLITQILDLLLLW
jgi:hypothetical protein